MESRSSKDRDCQLSKSLFDSFSEVIVTIGWICLGRLVHLTISLLYPAQVDATKTYERSNGLRSSVANINSFVKPFDCEHHKERSALRSGRNRVDILIFPIFATERLASAADGGAGLVGLSKTIIAQPVLGRFRPPVRWSPGWAAMWNQLSLLERQFPIVGAFLWIFGSRTRNPIHARNIMLSKRQT